MSKTKLSPEALRMRDFRKANPLHMRLLWREAYWRRKGFKNYEGVGLGGMEISAEVRRNVEALREQIRAWAYEYYILNAGPMDSAYDEAYDALVALEKKYPQLDDPSSPTRRVGAPMMTTQNKVRHPVPMLSLEKAKTPEQVVKFFGEYEGVVEPKIDGISLSLKYVNGRLIQAATRGNGSEGEDVTPNVRTIPTVPLMLRGKKMTIEVRGEVFMKWSDFTKHNERLIAEQDQPAANPRNAAGGALSLKQPSEVAKVPLSFVAYQIVGRTEGVALSRHTEVLELLEELGFMTSSALPAPLGECASVYQYGFKLNDLKEITSWISVLDQARRLQDFPTDGLVFKVDDLAAQQELGTGTTAPKWSLAFKYQPEQVKTRIKSIEWTVGKTGKVTPVAEFEPVVVSGSTVARASLCNPAEIKRLGVNVGDEVLIEKSNEIIPKVVKVVTRSSEHPADPPQKCPVCDRVIQAFPGYVDVFCMNPACAAQAQARLVYAVSKNALDIDGCGPQAVATFLEHGVVNLPALLASDCSCFKGVTKKKIQAGLAKAMAAPFWRKLSALCIERWGTQTCQSTATHFPCLAVLLDASDDKQLDFIIGEDKANELRIFLKSHNDEFVQLVELGYFPEEAEKVDGSLKGKSFCITGSVPGCPDRGIAEEEVRKRGGIAKSSVSRKLDFLVVGNEPGNNKLEGARRWGTKCISCEELFEMLNWNPKIEPPTAIDEK